MSLLNPFFAHPVFVSRAYVKNNLTVQSYLDALEHEKEIVAHYQEIRQTNFRLSTKSKRKVALSSVCTKVRFWTYLFFCLVPFPISLFSLQRWYSCAYHSVPFGSVYTKLSYCRFCLLQKQREEEKQKAREFYQQLLAEGRSTATEASKKAINYAYDLAAKNDRAFERNEAEALRLADQLKKAEAAAAKTKDFLPRFQLCKDHSLPWGASIFGKICFCPFCKKPEGSPPQQSFGLQPDRRREQGPSRNGC